MNVACALQRSKNLTLTSMGKKLSGDSNVKNKIKKVDRLEGNKALYDEIGSIYFGLSSFLFKYLPSQTCVL